MNPAMKMFTIGLRGEFVVSVTMVSDSPFDRLAVSRSMLNVRDSPGAASGIAQYEMSASASTL